MPRNWVTYLAGALSIVFGIVGAIIGLHKPSDMIDYIIAGLGVIGFRRAMSKGQSNG